MSLRRPRHFCGPQQAPSPLAFVHERAVATGHAAHADCHTAMRTLEHCLTPDGYATDATVDALHEVVAGPRARTLARLRPELPRPPDGEHEHAAALLRQRPLVKTPTVERLPFVRHDGIEPTNNTGERAIRRTVIIRKTSLGSLTGHGCASSNAPSRLAPHSDNAAPLSTTS